jgi:hypothetical protein
MKITKAEMEAERKRSDARLAARKKTVKKAAKQMPMAKPVTVKKKAVKKKAVKKKVVKKRPTGNIFRSRTDAIDKAGGY